MFFKNNEVAREQNKERNKKQTQKQNKGNGRTGNQLEFQRNGNCSVDSTFFFLSLENDPNHCLLEVLRWTSQKQKLKLCYRFQFWKAFLLTICSNEECSTGPLGEESRDSSPPPPPPRYVMNWNLEGMEKGKLIKRFFPLNSDTFTKVLEI